jgi:hypothetical protein
MSLPSYQIIAIQKGWPQLKGIVLSDMPIN